MATAFIGMGSNLGSRHSNLIRALSLISSGCRIILVSSLYETEPMYVTDQPRFLNAVVKISTKMGPPALLGFLNGIEASFGRDRANERRFGERKMDLDMLLFGQAKIKRRDLVIPHPRMHERAFVLVPLYEIEKGPWVRRRLEALPAKELSGVNLFNCPAWPVHARKGPPRNPRLRKG